MDKKLVFNTIFFSNICGLKKTITLVKKVFNSFSSDTKCSKYLGVLNLIKNEDLVVLNGTSERDKMGNFRFIRGSEISVITLNNYIYWLFTICDFKVVNRTGAEHVPVKVGYQLGVIMLWMGWPIYFCLLCQICHELKMMLFFYTDRISQKTTHVQSTQYAQCSLYGIITLKTFKTTFKF